TSPTPSTRADRPQSAAPSPLRCFFYGERYSPKRGRFLSPLALSRAAVKRRTESKDAAPSSPGKRDPHVIPERPPPHTAAGSFAKGSGVAVRVCAQREGLIRR